MKPADVAPGMRFSLWTVIGPACPEYRERVRFVECLCWSCSVVYEISAQSLVNGTSTRCRPCSLARRNAQAQFQILSPELLKKRRAQAERLALIRQAAERQQTSGGV